MKLHSTSQGVQAELTNRPPTPKFAVAATHHPQQQPHAQPIVHPQMPSYTHPRNQETNSQIYPQQPMLPSYSYLDTDLRPAQHQTAFHQGFGLAPMHASLRQDQLQTAAATTTQEHNHHHSLQTQGQHQHQRVGMGRSDMRTDFLSTHSNSTGSLRRDEVWKLTEQTEVQVHADMPVASGQSSGQPSGMPPSYDALPEYGALSSLAGGSNGAAQEAEMGTKFGIPSSTEAMAIPSAPPLPVLGGGEMEKRLEAAVDKLNGAMLAFKSFTVHVSCS